MSHNSPGHRIYGIDYNLPAKIDEITFLVEQRSVNNV